MALFQPKKLIITMFTQDEKQEPIISNINNLGENESVSTILDSSLIQINPVNKVLVGIIGIGNYIPEISKNEEVFRPVLKGVPGDIDTAIDLFANYMGYQTLVLCAKHDTKKIIGEKGSEELEMNIQYLNKENRRTEPYIYEEDVTEFLGHVLTRIFNQTDNMKQ